MCNRICEVVLAIMLLVGGLLNLAPATHKWLLVVVGIILFVHAFTCKKCCGAECNPEVEEKKTKKKSK